MGRGRMNRGRIYRRQIHRRTDLGGGGAEGSRTPDLLIANETLYQLSYDPVPKCARRCRFGDDVARTGFRSVGFFGFLWTWALVIVRGWLSWKARSGVVGLGGVSSGAEVGSGVDDPPHLVEPPGSPFSTTGSEASDAPRCSTEGDRGDFQWQPGGHSGVCFVEGTVWTVHAMSLRGLIRQWLSKGSSFVRFFFQTIGGV